MPKENIHCIGMPEIRIEVGWSNGTVQLATVHTDSPIVWPEGDTPDGKFNGWYATLDRDGINRAIRTLRRARDSAYGADA